MAPNSLRTGPNFLRPLAGTALVLAIGASSLTGCAADNSEPTTPAPAITTVVEAPPGTTPEQRLSGELQTAAQYLAVQLLYRYQHPQPGDKLEDIAHDAGQTSVTFSSQVPGGEGTRFEYNMRFDNPKGEAVDSNKVNSVYLAVRKPLDSNVGPDPNVITMSFNNAAGGAWSVFVAPGKEKGGQQRLFTTATPEQLETVPSTKGVTIEQATDDNIKYLSQQAGTILDRRIPA